MSYSTDPADGATTRKNRIIWMLQLVAQYPKGISEIELVKKLRNAHGLTARTAGSYVQEKVMDRILVPAGGKLYLDQAGFNEHLSAIGYSTPPVVVVCSDCGASYTSTLTNCPTCSSVERVLLSQFFGPDENATIDQQPHKTIILPVLYGKPDHSRTWHLFRGEVSLCEDIKLPLNEQQERIPKRQLSAICGTCFMQERIA